MTDIFLLRLRSLSADDPVEAELFLSQLLKGGARIFEIKHDGVNLEPHAYDDYIQTVRSVGYRFSTQPA